MHDKSRDSLKMPGPDEIVLPLPREMPPWRWAVRVAWWVVVAAAFVVLLRYDMGLMRWRYEVLGEPKGLFKELVVTLRFFGQPVAIVIMMIAVAMTDRRRWFVIGCVILAQLLAAGVYNAGKLTVVRYRPMAATEEIAPVEQLTQEQVWRGLRLPNREHKRQSFPSGHSASAFLVAGVMVWFYPRLRWLFWALAAGCAASRYVDAVHWPSDCLAGAAIGYCAAWMALRPYAWVLPIIWYRRRVKRRQAQKRRAGATDGAADPQRLAD